MNNKLNKVIAAILLLAITFALGRQYGINEEQKKGPKVLSAQTGFNQPLKIGSVLPMTGDYGAIGKEINKGALIAIDEARSKGQQVVYINEDDQFKASDSVNAANKLVNQDKIDAAFTLAIEEIKPMAPIFNNAKIPVISTWDSNNYIKNAGDYIFSTSYNTEANGEKMAEYAYNNLGLKKVAQIEQIDEWSQLISSAFSNKFKSLGGTITLDEKVPANEDNFRTIISKIKASGAEGIYFPFNPPGNSRFITQLKQQNFQGQLLSGDGFIQDEINTSGSAAENVYITTIYADNEAGLLAKYKSKYGKDASAPVFVAFGYDAINGILKAKENSDKNQTSLRDGLTQDSFLGAGGLINMNGLRYSEKIERLYQVKNGVMVEVKE